MRRKHQILKAWNCYARAPDESVHVLLTAQTCQEAAKFKKSLAFVSQKERPALQSPIQKGAVIYENQSMHNIRLLRHRLFTKEGVSNLFIHSKAENHFVYNRLPNRDCHS